MAWDSVDQYFSGQGVVLLAKRKADGTPGPFFPAGNVSDLKLTVAVSVLEHKESKTGQRATDLRLTTETKVGLSMTGEDFSAANFARVSRGEAVDVVGATATNIPMNGYKGGVTALGHIKVSAVTVKVDVTPDPDVTLTAFTTAGVDWDYKLNPEAGSIMLNPDSASWANLAAEHFTVVDGEDVASLIVTYTYAAQKRVDALTVAEEELFMRFEGLNTADGNEPVVVDVFRFRTDPLKELALISDGVQQFVLEGSVLYDGARVEGSNYFSVKKAS